MLCSFLLYSKVNQLYVYIYPRSLSYSRFSLVIYFIHNSVYMSIPVSQFILPSSPPWTSLVAQTVKYSPAMQETWVQSLGREDLLEKEMATHSSILAWKMPWTKEPGGLQSMASQGRPQLSDFTFTFHSPFGIHTFVFSICISISALQIVSSVLFF